MQTNFNKNARKFTCISAVLLLTTSCATMFSPKNQDVTIRTNDREAEVYIDDSLRFEGESGEVRFRKDMRTHQVVVKKEGYEDAHYTIMQTKKSPLYIMSIFPGVLAFYPPFYDIGNKAQNYEKVSRVYRVSESPVVEKTEEDKYIFINKTAFDIENENIEMKNIRWDHYIEDFDFHRNRAKNVYSRMPSSDEDLKLENSIFTETLNELLKERGFTDTSEAILKNKSNTLYIEAVVDEFSYYNVFKYFFNVPNVNSFALAEMKITWTIRDAYKKKLFDYDDKVMTDEFAVMQVLTSAVYNNPDVVERNQKSVEERNKDIFSLIIENAFQKSLSNLMNTRTMASVRKISDESEDFDSLALVKPTNVAKKLNEGMQAAVTVKLKDGHGSGFFITNDGYLITNYHVVATAEEDEIKVVMNSGDEYPAEIVRVSDYDDLAILKIDLENEFSFDFDQTVDAEVGDEIFVIGTPSNISLNQTLSKGIISGKRKNEDEQSFYQTDASINGGNSGGPLVTKQCNLIGIVNAKLVGIGVEGVGFGIPLNRAINSLKIVYIE
ncbi:MAG: hypothetical protein COA32_12045 [Fluviicola sp.]|nr:MAG: hypothetical protein COA32_12045 [Fluviicola sp.]